MRASVTVWTSRRGSASTSSGSGGSTSTRWTRSPATARWNASARESRPSATAASAARQRRPAPSWGCGRSSTWRSSDATAAALRERFEPTRDRVADAFDDRVRAGISPHAPYSCSPELYRACAESGAPAGHPSRRERGRERVAARRNRPVAGTRGHPRPAARHDRDPGARRRRSARSARSRRPLRARGRRGDRSPRGARRRGCALPALERASRMRRRTAHSDAGSRDPCLHRNGQPCLDALVRHVRRDARRDRRRTGARTPPGCADGGRRARARHARRRSCARARERRPARSSPASTPISPSSRWPRARSSPGKILLRPLFSAARPTASSLLSCPARLAMREEGRHGPS